MLYPPKVSSFFSGRVATRAIDEYFMAIDAGTRRRARSCEVKVVANRSIGHPKVLFNNILLILG